MSPWEQAQTQARPQLVSWVGWPQLHWVGWLKQVQVQVQRLVGKPLLQRSGPQGLLTSCLRT